QRRPRSGRYGRAGRSWARPSPLARRLQRVLDAVGVPLRDRARFLRDLALLLGREGLVGDPDIDDIAALTHRRDLLRQAVGARTRRMVDAERFEEAPARGCSPDAAAQMR